MTIMTRQDALALLQQRVVPDVVREKFVDAGILDKTVTTDSSGNPTTSYAWKMDTFDGVPDDVVRVLYAEIKRFSIDYAERERYVNQDESEKETLPVQEYTWRYEMMRELHISPPPVELTTKDTLQAYALAFARHFIYQWRRYQ